ncbi:MAG: acyltransferase [Oscillatoria princeps RMCB-10]|jgi:hypothetical protein|nr:acyltransferase [Oscillatoria princeps RMCB-10]
MTKLVPEKSLPVKISPEVSARIQLLRFPLIAAIVFIHSALPDVSPASKFIQNLGSNTLARVSVPLFFIISAFLFYFSFQLSFESWIKKLKSRSQSLLIPYLFWNLSFLLLLLGLQSIPATSALLAERYSQKVLDFNIEGLAGAIFPLKGEPILLHFWFIRDLIIYTIFSPLFLIAAKRAPYPVLGLLALQWFFPSDLRVLSLNPEGTFFYYLGCLMAVQRWDLTRADKHKNLIVPAYLTLAIAVAGLLTADVGGLTTQIVCLTKLLGIVACWCAASELGKKAQKILFSLSGFAFFLYAAHEPAGGIFRKLVYRFHSPENSVTFLLYYFLLPGLTIALVLAVGWVLQKSAPKFFQVVTGGRG